MNIQKLLKRANMIRVGGNAHRFICRIDGKLRTLTTDKKDFASDLASLFSNLNASSLTPKAAMSLALAAMMGFSSFASAANLPTGGSVVGGSANISTSGHTMNVDTHTNRTGINWYSFDIGNGYTVNFNQPSASSAVLNTVTGGSPSQIMGNLNSNGSVYLINTAGIIFGSQAAVNVGSLFASTIPMSQNSIQNFMNGGNSFTFSTNSTPAAIVNNGKITVGNKGFAAFAGGAFDNSGTINAPNGYVGVGVGQQVTFNIDPSIGARLTVNKELAHAVAGYVNAIRNTGNINADGGLIQLQAILQNNIYTSAVNNSGRIQANTLSVNDKGEIQLSAKGGDIQVSGNVVANGSSGANTRNGGTVSIQTDGKVNLQGNIQAAAATGGTRGQVTVQGGGDVQTTGSLNTGGAHLAATSTNGSVTLNNVDTQGGNINVTAHQNANLGDLNAQSANITALAQQGNVNVTGHTQAANITLESQHGNIANSGHLDASNQLQLTVHNNGNILGNGVFGSNHLAMNLGNGNATVDGTVGGNALQTQVSDVVVNNTAGGTGAVRLSNDRQLTINASDMHDGALDVSTASNKNLLLNGDIHANTATLNSGGALHQQAGTLSADTASLHAKGNIDRTGSFNALTMNANKLTANSDTGSATLYNLGNVEVIGTNQAAKDFTLGSNGDMTVTGSIKSVQGHTTLVANQGNIQNNGSISSDGTGVTLSALNGGVLSNNFIGSAQGIDIYAGNGNLANSGTIRAQGDVNLAASNDVGNYWVVDSTNGNVNVNAGHDVYNSPDGQITGANGVTVNAANDVTNHGLIAGQNSLAVTAGHNIHNSSTGVLASDSLVAAAGNNLGNRGLIVGQDALLYAGHNIRNHGVLAAQNLYALAGNNINNSGNGVILGRNVLLGAGHDINNTGYIVGRNLLAAAGSNINNTGVIFGQNVGLLAGNDVNNIGQVSARGDLAVLAANNINNYNVMTGNNTVLLAGNDINNNGLLAGYSNLGAYAGHDINNNANAVMDGGNIYLNAANDINVAGQVGSSLTALASLNAGHDVNVTSTETGDCCDPNGPTANLAGRVFGDTVNINAVNNVKVDGYVGDGRANSTVNVTAGNNILGRGLFSGNTVNLRSTNGNIGSTEQSVRTAANFLSLNAPNGSVYVNQLGSVSLMDSSALGTFTLNVLRACNAPASSTADLTILGNVNGHVVNLTTANGNIISTGLTSGFNVNMTANGGSIIDGNGDALNLVSTGDSHLWADNTIGSLSDPFDVKVGDKLYVGAAGSFHGVSIDINGTTRDNTLHATNRSPGAVIFNGQYLFGAGPVREGIDHGIPYMLQDYRNLTNPLFSTAANTSGKLLKPGALQNTKAEIINKWQQPEPFDLRLIQSEDQGEAYELLMNH